jgi:hypothetical protein
MTIHNRQVLFFLYSSNNIFWLMCFTLKSSFHFQFYLLHYVLSNSCYFVTFSYLYRFLHVLVCTLDQITVQHGRVLNLDQRWPQTLYFNYFTLFQHMNKQVVHTTHWVKFSFGTNKSRLHKIPATMIKCRKSLFMKSDVNTNKIHWTTHVHAELWSGPVYTQVHVKICINSWMWQNKSWLLESYASVTCLYRMRIWLHVLYGQLVCLYVGIKWSS